MKEASGRRVAIGPVAVNPKDGAELVAPVKVALAPGTYTASWHAMGAGTHHVAGHYSFEVRR